jgi:hypothetical protein
VNEDLELQEARWLSDYSSAAAVMAQLHGIAWRALVEQLGSEAALKLAPQLLPLLVHNSRQEADALAQERMLLQAQLQQPLAMRMESPW